MRIDVLSLFPDMFKPTLGQSIVGRAQDDGFLDIHVTDFRHFTTDKHNHVDDAPFGGGAGMLLQAQPIFDAMAAIDEEAQKENYPNGLLEYPQYTRPAEFRGMKVPEVLTSGNHEKIRQWRMYQSLKRTWERRPDLIEQSKLSREQQIMLQDIKLGEDPTMQ